MKKFVLLLFVAVLTMFSRASAEPLSWEATPMKLGLVNVMDQSWGIERVIGVTRAAPEFTMPVQLIWENKETCGLFGFQFRSPQLESRLIPRTEEVMEWKTPWGADMGMVKGKTGNHFTDYTREWTAARQGTLHFVISRKDGWQFSYAKGYLQEVQAPHGRRLVFRYQSKNLLTAVVQVNPQGGAEWPLVEIVSDPATERAQSIKIAGVVSKFSFAREGEDASLRLASWSRGKAPAEKFEYGTAGVLRTITAPSGRQTVLQCEFEKAPPKEKEKADAKKPDQPKIAHSVLVSDGTLKYAYSCGVDTKGPLSRKGVSATDKLGRTQNVNFSRQRGMLTLTDAAGQTTTVKYYRRLGCVYDYKLRSVRNEQGQVLVENKYDDDGNLIWSKDVLGNVTQYTVDGKGRVVRVDRAAAGGGASETVAKFLFDGSGNLVRTLDALNQAVELRYAATGELIGLTDKEGLKREISWDARGFVTSVRNAAGRCEKLEYDSYGRLARQISADGVVNEFVFNDAGQMSEVKQLLPGAAKDKALTVVKRTFDADGRLLMQTDALGRTSRNEFDSEGHLIASINPAGVATRYERDEVGRLKAFWLERATPNSVEPRASSVEQSMMGRVSFERDALDRILKQTNAIGQEQTWQFDKQGRLAGKDNGVQPVRYSYNKLGQTVAVDYGHGNVLKYEHDSLGRVAAMTTPTSSARYSFDKLGRITEIKMTRGKENASLQYGYTPSGKKASVAWSRSDGVSTKSGKTEYRFNPAGQLADLVTDGKAVAHYVYAENGTLREKQLVDGTRVIYSNDAQGRITGMAVVTEKGKTLTNVTYTWDAAGQLTSRTWDRVRQDYSYDKAGQLVAVTSSDPKKLPSEKYAFDLAGNMVEKSVGGIKTSMTYDTANRLLAASVMNQVSGVKEEKNFKYDNAGRLVAEMIGDKSTRYQYGLFEKTSGVIKPDGSRVGFDYWPSGQISAKGSLPPMIQQQGEDGPPSSDFGAASGMSVAAFLNAVKESKSEIASDKFKQTESMLWDGLALLQRGEETFSVEPHVSGGVPLVSNDGVIISDFLGTTLGTVKGETFTPMSLTAFGEASREVGAQAKSFYTGKPWDADLQGYNFLYRNYQPGLARWTMVDPSGFPDGVNNFAYAPVPTNGLDPLGLVAITTTYTTGLNTGSTSGLISPLTTQFATLKATSHTDSGGKTCYQAVIDKAFAFSYAINVILPQVGLMYKDGLFDEEFFNTTGIHESWHQTYLVALLASTYGVLESWSGSYLSGHYTSEDAAINGARNDISSAIGTAFDLFRANIYKDLDYESSADSYCHIVNGVWRSINPDWGYAAVNYARSISINFTIGNGNCNCE
ncbi:MAG: hypothetical protein PHV34_10885 [Verrucomicrobiae bacterium]|nr:hypothetical protein [Verrucomicrobiae bacterium]